MILWRRHALSIRLIAKDLYRLQREVARLEADLQDACPNEQADLEDRLRRLRAERDHVQAVLDGAKEPPPYRLPR